jgi:hypothetical protein
MFLALIFTAIVTPYEIGFLHSKFDLSPFALVNRGIDGLFGIDMVLRFFMWFEMAGSGGGRIVKDHKKIVNNYLRGWFGIDLISIIPYDWLADNTSPAMKNLKVMRLIRLLRLIKLLRLLRAARFIQKWQAEFAISYGVINFIFFGQLMIIGSHWLACILGVMAGMQDGDGTWLDALNESKVYLSAFCGA